MDILTIVLFFVYTWGLGFSLTFFFKLEKDFFELNLIRIGIGLGIIPFILVALNLLRLPIDWRIVLILSLIIPVYSLIKEKFRIPAPELKLTKNNIFLLIVLVLFAVSFYMYYSGANAYPYLEDDDPWGHASSINYVASEKTFNEPIPGQATFQYLNPYPPGYDGILAILHQTSASLSDVMKFFNALIISSGIIFFYLFVKNFTGSASKAALAAGFLFAIPSYLTHFIWAHSLVITLFFPALYCIEKIKENKLWLIPASASISGILLTQPDEIIKFGIFLIIYFLVKCFMERKFEKHIFLAGLFGIVLSLSWWAAKAGVFFSAAKGGAEEVGKSLFAPNGGTATRAYAFNDFFFAKSQGLINNQPGWGVILSILFFIGLISIILRYRQLVENKKSWIFISLIWFIFTFLGVNSMTFHLPFGLIAFRFWMLMAIPVCIIAAEGVWLLFGLFNNATALKMIILALVIIGVFFTSFSQKYALNTSVWPPGGGWISMDEVQGYVSLKSLPANTKVFPLTGEWQAWAGDRIIGMDAYFCEWCSDEIQFSDWYARSPLDVYDFLKSHRYEYALVDSHFFVDLQDKNATAILDSLLASNKFNIAYQNNGAVLLKVV